ncbi:CAP domain-containing protein [Streptomyces noursei]|nr:CAP domain-containing protein [Streptomyces noursei]
MNHDDTHRPASHHDAPHHAAPAAPVTRRTRPRPPAARRAPTGPPDRGGRRQPPCRRTSASRRADDAAGGRGRHRRERQLPAADTPRLRSRPGTRGRLVRRGPPRRGRIRPADLEQRLALAPPPPAVAHPSATERPAEQHPTPRTSVSQSPSHSAGGTTSHAPRAGAGTGRTPAVARAATGTAAEYAQKVLDLVNAQRSQHGCGPLAIDPHIQAAAQAHSDDMAARNYYAHDTPEGVDPGTRLTNAGFRWQSWGENIFKSPNDPATAVDGWMNSPGHRANILNCSYTSTGVGVNLSSNGPWWTQDFATRG